MIWNGVMEAFSNLYEEAKKDGLVVTLEEVREWV